MTSSAPHSEVSEPLTGPDRRALRRKERRDRVYAVAIELFVERGYDHTTMDDIAERAQVARATVFNHFERKMMFLDEWTARRRERAMGAVEADQLEDHHVSEILTRYLRELAHLNIIGRSETVGLMSASVQSTNVLGNLALGKQLGGFIRKGQCRGEFRPDIDADQGGQLLAAGYLITLTSWISTEPEPFDLDRELLKMLDVVLRGMVVTDPAG
ncbi:MAG TPA: TetR/AcrR family transcriptional regulator [Pseudonocardia sp.]|jgi:AcrR family transcriptional regulator|nr:TetR/AcrR family transcriptional regulator [Pseudonocardia sp.]